MIDLLDYYYSKNEYDVIAINRIMRPYIRTDIYSLNKKIRQEYPVSVKDYYIKEDEDLTIFHLTQRYNLYLRKINKC